MSKSKAYASLPQKLYSTNTLTSKPPRYVCKLRMQTNQKQTLTTRAVRADTHVHGVAAGGGVLAPEARRARAWRSVRLLCFSCTARYVFSSAPKSIAAPCARSACALFLRSRSSSCSRSSLVRGKVRVRVA